MRLLEALRAFLKPREIRLPLAADARFAACVAEVLKHEGGYVDHPDDPGGATNMGITLATLQDWRGKPVSKDDVRELTQEEAQAIYRARYWAAVKGDELPAGVDLAVFDYAVNSGPGRAVRELQRALGVVADGAIGPKTLAAVRAADAHAVMAGVCEWRRQFLQSLGAYKTFGRGWMRRVDEVQVAAARMLAP